MSTRRKIIWAIVLILIAIQFIRPSRNKSETLSANDISHKYTVSSYMQTTLQTACFDCHSNNTKYPWYTNIQPVGWWMQKHVNDGKRHLNFSEFLSYDPKKANHKMEEVAETVDEGSMPLDSYLWIHKDAKLSAEQKDSVMAWAKQVQQEIQQANPGIDYSKKR